MLFLERASDSAPGEKKSELLPSILQFYNFAFFSFNGNFAEAT